MASKWASASDAPLEALFISRGVPDSSVSSVSPPPDPSPTPCERPICANWANWDGREEKRDHIPKPEPRDTQKGEPRAKVEAGRVVTTHESNSLPFSSDGAERAVSADSSDDLEERVAIVEYDAGVPREWAEGFAGLDPDHAPGDVPLKRWRQFVDACGKFLDNGWAAKASELGWGRWIYSVAIGTNPSRASTMQGCSGCSMATGW